MLRDCVHFLVFGVLITVIVGWSCALWAERPVMREAADSGGPRWPAATDEAWPDQPRFATIGAVTGYRLRVGQTVRRIIDEDEIMGFRFGVEYRIERHEAGWPARSFTWQRWTALEEQGTRRLVPLPGSWRDLGRSRDRGLPYGVRPVAFTGNVAFYGAAGWLVFGMPVQLLRARRAWRNCCRACGYPRGDQARCTECGRSTDGE